jgi:hypothetical protein
MILSWWENECSPRSPKSAVSLNHQCHCHDDNESDLQKPVKHRLAWRSSWFSDNLAPRKIIEEIKILGVLANEHTGFFS